MIRFDIFNIFRLPADAAVVVVLVDVCIYCLCISVCDAAAGVCVVVDYPAAHH